MHNTLNLLVNRHFSNALLATVARPVFCRFLAIICLSLTIFYLSVINIYYVCNAVERAVKFGSLGNHSAAFLISSMHLLYLDDSGSSGNADEKYIVLGGISLYETQVYHITKAMDDIAKSIDPSKPNIEFHASEILARRTAPWNKMTKEDVRGVVKSILKILAGSADSTYAFACAIHKLSFPSVDPLKLAFEDISQRFDLYLRKTNTEGNNQRGLLILDESSHETSLQQLSIDFRTVGTKWGAIKFLADVPLFVDSKASRIVQLADHIAYAVFKRYNSGDSQYFDIIASKFYSSENIVHGLAHKHPKMSHICMCIACMSRRFSSSSAI